MEESDILTKAKSSVFPSLTHLLHLAKNFPLEIDQKTYLPFLVGVGIHKDSIPSSCGRLTNTASPYDVTQHARQQERYFPLLPLKETQGPYTAIVQTDDFDAPEEREAESSQDLSQGNLLFPHLLHILRYFPLSAMRLTLPARRLRVCWSKCMVLAAKINASITTIPVFNIFQLLRYVELFDLSSVIQKSTQNVLQNKCGHINQVILTVL